MRRGLVILVAVCAACFAPAAHAAFPGQNGKIAFSSEAPAGVFTIWTVNPDGTQLTELGLGRNADWSADGTKLAFDVAGEVWTMNADGSARTQLTTAGGTDPTWSPAGDEIAFIRQSRLWRMNADGTNQAVFGPPSPVCSPAWAPDGTRIVFQVGCGSPLLRTVDADDGEVRDLPSFINRADWSPGQVWFTGTGSGFAGVHLAATDGPSVIALGNDDVRGAAWSPDGTRLVYTTGESGGYALVTIGVAGDGRQELAPGLPFRSLPAWQPLPPAPSRPGYPRPKGATPLRVPLVPAMASCDEPNSTHGPPLAFASCSPARQSSSTLTVGTPDSNGQPTRSSGTLQLTVNVGSDVTVDFRITDVRCRVPQDTCPDGNLTDYAGKVEVGAELRMTDRWNGGSGLETATALDFSEYSQQSPLHMAAQCQPTADPTEGSDCSMHTSANAVAPGAVRAGKRATWQLGAVRVHDLGPDNEIFAVQGLFVP